MSLPDRPGFVVGLATEADLLVGAFDRWSAGIHPLIACAAANAERAGQGASRLLSEGADALVSFGIAGGLDPSLRPGDLVLAERILLPGSGSIATDPAWRDYWAEVAQAAGLHHSGGSLIGSAREIADTADKQRIFGQSGAAAVDLESQAVASVAAAASVPFVAVRAIADPAQRALPWSVVGSIGSDGRPRLAYLAFRLCQRPWEAHALLRLREDANAALSTLGRLIGAL